MDNNRSHTDSYIAFAVLIQSFLVILQQVLISVFHIPAESTTIYRVLLTAIPLSVAIVITLYRKWPIFLFVYGITIIVLLLNEIVYPQNEQFLWPLSLRFLLPIVIPSALCLMFISDVEVVEKVIYKISWGTTFLTLFYVVNIFLGTINLAYYNMSFSYALLLPILTLYSKKNIYSLIASAFLFITILVIGSRGAAIIFVLFIIYDIFQSNKKNAIILFILSGVLFFMIPLLAQWLENKGISSRTLNLLTSGNINHMAGRDYIYNKMINIFWSDPLTGIGLFGDRFYLKGSYSHNLILELFLNWGLIGATLIIFFFLRKIVLTFKQSDKNYKIILVKYFFAGVLPLMVSGSYLTDYDLGIFIGILYLISKDNKKRNLKTAYPQQESYCSSKKFYIYFKS
jgi:hypothetical protein